MKQHNECDNCGRELLSNGRCTCTRPRKAREDAPGLYLDWLADELDRTADPQRINTIKRVAGNVRALAGI